MTIYFLWFWIQVVATLFCTHAKRKLWETTIDTGSKAEYAKEILVEAVEALGCIVENLTITVFDVNIERKHYEGKRVFIDFEKQEVSIL